MIHRQGLRADEVQDLRVGAHVRARHDLRSDDDRLHSGASEESALQLECAERLGLVAWIEQPVGGDEWVARRVGGVDGDVPAREGGDERGEGRDVVFAVGRGVIEEVA